MGSLLNFRCPDELWESIEKIGKERHPGGSHHRSNRDYDLTATVLDILRAGISALENDPSLLDKTENKTIDKTEVQEMIQAAIATNKTDHQTMDKTEIQSMIQEAVANLPPIKREVTVGDIDKAIWQQLDQLVDMQGAIIGRVSKVETAIAPLTEEIEILKKSELIA
jgi:hypothetical protein